MNELLEITRQQRDFLRYYKKRFIDSFLFLMQAQKGKGQLLSRSSIASIAEKLYILLFLLGKDPTNDLYNFAYKAIKAGIDLKSVLVKANMKLFHEFIDYLLDKSKDPEEMHRSLLRFATLVDSYYLTIDKAYHAFELERRSEAEGEEQGGEEGEVEMVMKLLKEYRSKNINLLNYYKEIPVACKSSVVELEEKSARFDIEGCNYNIFEENGIIYIKIPGFPKAIRSSIFRYKKYDYIEVGDFRFEELPQEQRKSVRVQPEAPIEIELGLGEEVMKGVILDISAGGVGVAVESMDGLEKDVEVALRFSLKGEPLEALGTVRYVLAGNKKVGIQFLEDVEVENRVLEYVLERQFTIIKELRV